VLFSITDDAGQLVAQIPMTDALPGENSVLWDGKDAEGNPMPPGKYKFTATGLVNEKSQSLAVYGSARVNSVTLGDGQTLLNLAGIGQVPLSEVREISE
jgi:flagellar basal-body rod modification protein FlgD